MFKLILYHGRWDTRASPHTHRILRPSSFRPLLSTVVIITSASKKVCTYFVNKDPLRRYRYESLSNTSRNVLECVRLRILQLKYGSFHSFTPYTKCKQQLWYELVNLQRQYTSEPSLTNIKSRWERYLSQVVQRTAAVVTLTLPRRKEFLNLHTYHDRIPLVSPGDPAALWPSGW